MSTEITDADRRALERMPDEIWFGVDDIRGAITNPRYRCERLQQRGLLEYEVVGDDYRNLESRWRKLPRT